MRAVILVGAMIIRWAILEAADKDPRWSGEMAIVMVVLLAVALAWDIYDSYQQSRPQPPAAKRSD